MFSWVWKLYLIGPCSRAGHNTGSGDAINDGVWRKARRDSRERFRFISGYQRPLHIGLRPFSQNVHYSQWRIETGQPAIVSFCPSPSFSSPSLPKGSRQACAIYVDVEHTQKYFTVEKSPLAPVNAFYLILYLFKFFFNYQVESQQRWEKHSKFWNLCEWQWETSAFTPVRYSTPSITSHTYVSV